MSINLNFIRWCRRTNLV